MHFQLVGTSIGAFSDARTTVKVGANPEMPVSKWASAVYIRPSARAEHSTNRSTHAHKLCSGLVLVTPAVTEQSVW